MTAVEPLAAAVPVPPGRGRWRLALSQRAPGVYAAHEIGDLADARSRRLSTSLNAPATFTFALDGRSSSARLIRELEHELLVWRWSDAGGDVPMFRGPVTQSQDTLSEQRHTVTFTCHDYAALLQRRVLTRPATFNQVDQDTIVGWLRNYGAGGDAMTSSGQHFGNAGRLPLDRAVRDPAGNIRAGSGRLRDRQYPAQQNIGEALDNLANVVNGFDWVVGYPPVATPPEFVCTLDIHYPYKGIIRDRWAFQYGSTVSALSRSINSANYANYWRTIGQQEGDGPPPYAEGWTMAALDPVANPAGLWMGGDSISDATLVPTLAERVAVQLETDSILVPSYSLTLRPGTYRPGDDFALGDTVRLLIRSGRLDVDTWVRVLALEYVISDDNAEDFEIEVGRPATSFLRYMRDTRGLVRTLERR